MTTREEAREHIGSFWARRGISRNALDVEGNLNLRDLSESLKILSEQLYADTTHFIWELFQNADDSIYATDTPCVNLTLSNHFLTFQTNEIGFTRDDVESLCAIGFSSKAGQNDTIGEKGIGFKSVFRVADVVIIRSGVYAFKLDIRPPYGWLGMILPVWLNEEPVSGTLISLELKAGINHSDLRSQLASFDFSFLLFSRKIKIIMLNVIDGEMFHSSGELIYLGGNSYKIETMVDNRPSTTMEYVTLRYTVSNMPPRPGAKDPSNDSKTSVVFAFPHHNYQPALQPQKTYAFLPIAPFGFQFLIHADFVLIANRQDIQNQIPWNIRLQVDLPEAICLAFEQLATHAESTMRYSWPEYLNCLQYIHNPYMRTIADQTHFKLRSRRLVEMELSNPTFRAPADSLMALHEFRTTSKELLIPNGTHALRVMSTAYSGNSAIALRRLGVNPFTIWHFVEELQHYTSSDFASFSNNTAEWHSRVAELLVRHLRKYVHWGYSESFTKLQALNIIPLDGGPWVSGSSSKENNIFLDKNRKTFLPAGLDFYFVKADAADNPNRRKLYEMLGARECDEIQISRKIVEYHATDRPMSHVEDLKSHAVYVFRAGYRPTPGDPLRLRVVDSNDTPRYNSRVHLPFGRIGSIVRGLFADDFNGIVWLHPSYETMVTDGEKDKWVNFLLSLEGVNEWPPFVSHERLSDAMRYILARNGYKIFLGFLKTRNSLEPGGLLGSLGSARARAQTINDIKDIEVQTDRGSRKLCETILLPLSDASLDLLPVLELDDPKDTRWDFLRDFGVLTTLSLKFYVKLLRYLKANDDQERAMEKAKTIYNAIGAYPGLKDSQLAIFHKESLIYVGPGNWLCPDECIWRAKFRCTQVPALSKIYSGCGKLFRTLLGVRNAGLDELIAELFGIESSDYLERANVLRHDLLPALNSFLGEASPSEYQRRYLASAHIFPVTQIDASSSASTTFCQAGEKFWIADMNWLKLKFEGRLPLLDVTGGLFKRPIDNIFKVLSMDDRRLSKSVQTEQVQHQGVPIYDPALTSRLRRQSRYIIGIASSTDNVSPRLEEVSAKLSNVQVFRVQDIIIKRFVSVDDDGAGNDVRKYGLDDQGDVNLEDTEAELRVNIRQGIDIVDAVVPLTDSLAEYLNIRDSKRELLSKVLTTERVGQFMESLERAGIKIAEKPAVQDKAEAGFDEDSDNATLAEDPDEGLDSAAEDSDNGLSSDFRKMQIKEPRHLRTPDSRLGEAQPQGRSATPAAQSLQFRNDTRINSAISMSSRSNFPANRAEPTTTTAPRSASRTEPVESLTVRLSNTTLSDSTANVLNRNVVAPAAVVTGSGGPQVPIIGSATSFTLAVDSTALEAHSDNLDVSVSNSRRTSSTRRRISSTSSEIDIATETPTRTHRQSIRRVSPGRAFGNSYQDHNIIDQESSADTPDEIGFVGENLVYKFFEKKLSPLFTYENWTSRNRNKAFPNHPFGNGLLEKNFADFTYVDTDGKLGQYLGEKIPGFECATGQSNITYHLEVKTTLAGLETAALLSNNQISMAKMYSRRFSTSALSETHVYILVRVYGLGTDPPEPQCYLFPDPWALICESTLQIKGDSGIYVWPN